LRKSLNHLATASCTVSHALAQKAGGAEHQHGDQNEESEHVLIVAPEQNEVLILRTVLRKQLEDTY